MLYKDTITLSKQGNSHCFIIPAKWLKENKVKDYDYRVKLDMDSDGIHLYPLRSKCELKHPSMTGRQDLIEFKEPMPGETGPSKETA